MGLAQSIACTHDTSPRAVNGGLRRCRPNATRLDPALARMISARMISREKGEGT